MHRLSVGIVVALVVGCGCQQTLELLGDGDDGARDAREDGGTDARDADADIGPDDATAPDADAADADAAEDGDADAALEWEWWHTFHGGTGSDVAAGIAADSDGNLFVLGVSNASWNGPEDQSPLRPYAGGNDVFVLKLTGRGEYVWHTFYGSTGDDTGGGIAVSGAGNVFVTGRSRKAWDGPDGEAPLRPHDDDSTFGATDAFVLGLGPDGAYRWHTFYGMQSGWAFGRAVALDPGGGIVVAGEARCGWNGPGGEPPLHPHGGLCEPFEPGLANIMVLALDASGGYRWHTFWGSGRADAGARAIVSDDTDGLFVSGASSSSWSGEDDRAPLHGYSGGSSDAVVLRLTTDGAYDWHTFYGSRDSSDTGCVGSGMAVGGGAVVVAGSASRNWNGPAGEMPRHAFTPIYMGTNTFVLRLGTDGSYGWHGFWEVGGGMVVETPAAVALLPDDDVRLLASPAHAWDGPGGEPPLHEYAGYADVALIALDADGLYRWHSFFGSAENDTPTAAMAADGWLYFAGTSRATWNGPEGETPLHGHSGSHDIFVATLRE